MMSKPGRRDRAYRRWQTRRHRQKRKDIVQTYGRFGTAGYLSWTFIDGDLRPSGNHIHLYSRSRRQRFWKNYTSRVVRRHPTAHKKGNGYRRSVDYWWNIY